VAQDGEAMKPKKRSRSRARNPEWPVGKPIPDFGSTDEEDAFWGSFSFADVIDAYGEKPSAANRRSPRRRKAREHVYRVRLDDAERAALQRMAERRGVRDHPRARPRTVDASAREAGRSMMRLRHEFVTCSRKRGRDTSAQAHIRIDEYAGLRCDGSRRG